MFYSTDFDDYQYKDTYEFLTAPDPDDWYDELRDWQDLQKELHYEQN